MHTRQLAKEVLYSLPIEVEFAGFRGNTLSLAQGGWDLSMQQQLSPMRGEYEMRLAMRHDGAKLYALSNPIYTRMAELSSAIQNPVVYAQFLSRQCFFIAMVAPEIQFLRQPIRSAVRYGDTFSPIDAYPSERMEMESIKDFKFFKVANPTIKDIIVTPGQVPELLDMILKTQGTQQKEIRERNRSRENLNDYRDGMFETRPAHHVQAQLISLAS